MHSTFNTPLGRRTLLHSWSPTHNKSTLVARFWQAPEYQDGVEQGLAALKPHIIPRFWEPETPLSPPPPIAWLSLTP